MDICLLFACLFVFCVFFALFFFFLFFFFGGGGVVVVCAAASVTEWKKSHTEYELRL